MAMVTNYHMINGTQVFRVTMVSMYVYQIYCFGAMSQLLVALKNKHSMNQAEADAACELVAELQQRYALTPSELMALSNEMETVQNLVSVLVQEHNEVASRQRGSSQLDSFVKMRLQLLDDAKSDDRPMPTNIKQVSGQCRKTMMTVAKVEKVQFYKTVMIPLLKEDSWELFVSILKKNKAKAKEGTSAKKAKSKEKPKDNKLAMGVFENLIGLVDDEGIYKVLREIERGERDWKSLSQWLAQWTQTKSTFVVYFMHIPKCFVPILDVAQIFCILHFLFFFLEMYILCDLPSCEYCRFPGPFGARGQLRSTPAAAKKNSVEARFQKEEQERRRGEGDVWRLFLGRAEGLLGAE